MHNITIVPGEISTNFSSVDSIYYFKQIIHNLEFLLLQTSLCQILPRVLLPLDHAQLLQLSLLLCPVPSPVSTGSWCAEAALPSVFCSTRGNMTLLRTIEERENLFQIPLYAETMQTMTVQTDVKSRLSVWCLLAKAALLM